MAILTPTPKMQFFAASGAPLAGGKLYTYAAGTTTPLATYTDDTGATANTNPIILDSRGEASIWLSGDPYKFKLTDANDVEIWTVDDITPPSTTLGPTLTTPVVIQGSTPQPALKITQTGGGPALLVQDSADPDSTPFVVDTAGNVGIGTLSPSASLEIVGGSYKGAWAYLPSGTAMLFIQTAAPTGWTKSTAYDNRALRITTGSASVGGTLGFTDVFVQQAVAGTNAGTALSEAQMPAHFHVNATDYQVAGGSGVAINALYLNPKISAGTPVNTSTVGSGETHTHTFTGTAIDLRVAYVDAIIAVKD